jgi:hypothetical protein
MRGLRQVRQQRENLSAAPKVAERYFAENEWMTDDTGIDKEHLKAGISVPEVIHPDRGIDHITLPTRASAAGGGAPYVCQAQSHQAPPTGARFHGRSTLPTQHVQRRSSLQGQRAYVPSQPARRQV